MKKRGKIQKLTSFLLVFVMLLGAMFQSKPVFAEGNTHNDVITKMEAQVQDGSGSISEIGHFHIFRLSADFALPNGQVKKGDTTTIKIPDELMFNQTSSIEINDDEGHLIANAVFDFDNKKITLTYTDYAESHSDVKGNFYFFVRLDRDVVEDEMDIPLKFDVDGNIVDGGSVHFTGYPNNISSHLAKSGWQDANDDNKKLYYQLKLNTKNISINNAVVTDTITSEGITFDQSSVVIKKGTWKFIKGDLVLTNPTDVTSQYTMEWSDDGRTLTINFGNLSEDDHFEIRYKANSSYGFVDGEELKNTATLTGDNLEKVLREHTTKFFAAGGSGEGYIYSIKILKESKDGTPLADAKFDIIRVATGVKVGTITTNDSGVGEFNGLLKDEYELQETDAPEGFKKLDEPIRIKISDFGTNKVAEKTVVNEPADCEVKVTKIWEDKNDQDGKRPESVTIKLLADGEETGKTLTLTKANNWTGTFTDLVKYKAGKKIEYTVKEEPVGNGYVSVITGSAEDGYKVTNTREPEKVKVEGKKTWNDKDNQDGKRPAEITINLLKNGTKIDSVKVKEADGWKWKFEGLDKYENGNEITYSISEEQVEGYSAEINGYDVKNSYTPGKTSVQVTKAWEDKNDQDGKRPESITIKLLADGEETGKTLTLTKADNWTGTFTDLDEYKAGKKIEYTIKEESVGNGYVSIITGSAEDGYVVTNVRTPNTPPEKPNKELPKTGDGSNMSLYALLMLTSGTLLLLIGYRRRKHAK